MISSINVMCKQKFEAHMSQRHAEYKKAKIKKAAGLAAYDIYAWSPVENRTAWIIFGGDKDHEDLLTADIAWTKSGCDLSGLEFIPWHQEADVLPEDGAAKMTAKAVVGADFSGSVNFEIARPPAHVQEASLENFTHSDLFKKVTANKVATKLKKDPGMKADEAAAAALAENLAGNRLFFRFWSQCEKWMELSPADLEAAVNPEMDRLIRVLDEFAVPFLQKRLA